MEKILIVDDDLNICELLRLYIEKDGYSTVVANDGIEAIKKFKEENPALVLLDLMLPGKDGLEVCREIRKESNCPIIMLTAKGEVFDKVLGLELGADDYMVKPINVSEMVLRVGALLRRVQMMNEHRQVIGETVMECDSLTVTRGETSMILPQKEFMLLYKMAAYPGKIFTRQQLMDDIWGYDSDSDSHTVDVHIGRLRERFRDNPDFHIVTMRGVGYKVVKA